MGVERNAACGTCSKCRGCIKCSVQVLSAWIKRSWTYLQNNCEARSFKDFPILPKFPTTIHLSETMVPDNLQPGVVPAEGIFPSNFSAQLVAKSKQIQGVGPEVTQENRETS